MKYTNTLQKQTQEFDTSFFGETSSDLVPLGFKRPCHLKHRSAFPLVDENDESISFSGNMMLDSISIVSAKEQKNSRQNGLFKYFYNVNSIKESPIP